jgi:hypothetical protein
MNKNETMPYDNFAMLDATTSTVKFCFDDARKEIVYVKSLLREKATQVGGSSPETIALRLLSEIVRKEEVSQSPHRRRRS